MSKILRNYQEKIVNVLKKMEEKGNYSTIVELPTGAGKTLTALSYLVPEALEKGHKVLWLTHRALLLQQVNSVLEENFEKKPNKVFKKVIVSGGNQDLQDIKLDTDIVFGSIYSMVLKDTHGVSNFKDWLENSSKDGEKLFIVIDEAHHVGANIYDDLLEGVFLPDANGNILIKNYALIGLTATPFREDAQELRLMKWFKNGYEEKFTLDTVEMTGSSKEQKYLSFKSQCIKRIDTKVGEDVEVKNKKVVGRGNPDFGNVIKVIEMQDLIKAGVLIEPYFYRVDDFENENIVNKLDGVSKSIVENIKNSKDLGKTIIFVPRKDMAEEIADKLNNSGFKSISITDKNSNEIMAKIEAKGKVNVDVFDICGVQFITTVDVISEGFDVPELNTIILATGTISRNRLRQRIGRVVRSVENKDKKARVIWYHIARNNDDVKYGSYIIESSGYRTNDNDEMDVHKQSDESIERDRERKTYYLTAPKYSQPMGYATEYDYAAYKEYIDFLDILSQFANNEELTDFIGFYSITNYQGNEITKILLDDLLLEGFQHLFRRVRSQWLILRDDGKYVDNITDFTKELGISVPDYIEDAMKICFFLCKPKKTSVFYAEYGKIWLFINAVLQADCTEPKLIILHKDIMDFAQQLYENGVVKPASDLSLEDILASNEEISIRDNTIRGIPKTVYDEIFKDYKLNDEVKEEMIRKAVENVITNERIKTLNKIKEICEEKDCASVADLTFSSITKALIVHDKKQIAESYKKHRNVRKEHTKELRVDNYINYELEDLADAIKKRRVNWSDTPVKYLDNGRDRVFIEADIDVSGGKLVYPSNPSVNKMRLPRKSMVNSTIAICQSILENTHHIGVSDIDVDEYEKAVEKFVEALGVTITGEIRDLAKDIVCKIGSDDKDIYFKNLIQFFRDNEIKLPRYFAYLIYDRVYEAVWRNVNFLDSNGVVSAFCQNEQELIDIEKTILNDYNLPRVFFDDYKIYPVADAIYDYRPYTKVLRSYLGIKPDLLCRMMNVIAKQATGCDHFITGCGGSGAGLINRFNPINDEITQETYNDYGYVMTKFFEVLKDEIKYKELLGKIKRFTELMCDTDEKAINVQFIEPIYDYFVRKGNDKKGQIKRVFIQDGNVCDLFTIGVHTRKYIIAEDELIIRFLRNYPAVKHYYLIKNNEDEVKAFDNAKADIQRLENLLHGVYRVFEQFYLWCQSTSCDQEVIDTGVSDVDIAFVVYFFYSFPVRYRFNDCHIESFIKFATSYEQNIKMGHERVKDWDIYPTEYRDVNKVLSLPVYNKETAIAYCDIPYAETSDALYVAACFDFDKFVSVLDDFKGKYIVSSRYNICTKAEFKFIYYLLEIYNDNGEIVTEESGQDLHEKNSAKLIRRIMKDIETNNIFFTEAEKKEIIKSLTSGDEDNKKNAWNEILSNMGEYKNHLKLKVFSDRATSWTNILNNKEEYKNHLTLKAFSDKNIIISNEDDIKKLIGRTAYDNRIKNILDFYQSFANMKSENGRPKYIVIPYTNTQEIQSEDKKSSKVIRNNYRLTESDVDIMFKNTIFSNIPVEVMITNVDMIGVPESKLAERDEEKHLIQSHMDLNTEEQNLLQMYRVSSDIYALPTVKATDSGSYMAEPIYLVLTYDKYMDYMERNILREERADAQAKDAANYFLNYLNSR